MSTYAIQMHNELHKTHNVGMGGVMGIKWIETGIECDKEMEMPEEIIPALARDERVQKEVLESVEAMGYQFQETKTGYYHHVSLLIKKLAGEGV